MLQLFSFLLPVPLYPSLLLISTITSFKCIARLTFVGDNITLSRRNPENLITIMCEVDSGDYFYPAYLILRGIITLFLHRRGGGGGGGGCGGMTKAAAAFSSPKAG